MRESDKSWASPVPVTVPNLITRTTWREGLWTDENGPWTTDETMWECGP